MIQEMVRPRGGVTACRGRTLQVIGVCALFALGAARVLAASYLAPTLADGKTPDLRGIWQARGTAYVNIEGHKGGKGLAASPSIVVDPADGRIPYKPDALAKRDENFRKRAEADPSLQCSQAGVPRITYLPTPFQIVQSPGYTAFVYQDNHSYRIIYPSSKPHLTGVDWWMGDSRGHWEGSTLVVDVTTQNDLTWLDGAGNHHTSDIHVVERYTPTGAGTMTYEALIDDPNTYTRPWTLRTTLYRNTAKGARIIEDECLEDINGVFRHILPTDPANVLRNNYRRWSLPADGAAPAKK